MKKSIALILALVLCLGCLTACGGSGSSADPENSFTWWLQVGDDASYFMEYEDNPSVIHMLRREFAGVKIAIDFSVAPAGTAQDNFNQMLATGEYQDIISMGGMVSQTAYDLYKEGVILDLTELVQQYMPNYWNHVQTNSVLAESAWTDVDGERKLLQLYNFSDAPQPNFQGYLYRRDWVAKYGANPSTGAAFTGGLTDENDVYSWQDDVLFPSFYNLTYDNGVLKENAATRAFMEQYAIQFPEYDGTYPVTITDWEWMFEIFEKAHEDLGIDCYMTSQYFVGYNAIGALNASFGCGAPTWYRDPETNEVRYGGTEDSMKAYLECVSGWYEKGWLDKEFDTRSDMFYMIDTPATYQGKVGMWIGIQGQTGAQMATGDAYTEGLMAYGCPYPVNDIYGGESQKYVIPNSYYAFPIVMDSVGITTAAQGKNLEALLTMMDYMYSEEGALYKSCGLTREQAEEIGAETYLSYCPNGGYTVREENGERYYDYTLEAAQFRPASTAMRLNRMNLGLSLIERVNQGLDRYTDMATRLWDLYPTSSLITDSMKAKLTPDEQKTRSKVENNINTYMSQTVPKFIKGELDVNGTDWDDFCTTQNKYGVKKLTGIYQEKYDAMK